MLKILKKTGPVFALFIASLIACRFFQQPVTATPQQPVNVNQLKFTDADTDRRFKALDACIRQMAGPAWKGGQYDLIGNFYQADWCTGKGASADCQITQGTIDQRDQHNIELYSLFYAQDYPQVFGLGLQARQVPASTGWGANFYFSEKGGGIVGEGWGVTFRQYLTSSQPADALVDIGSTYEYIIYGPNQVNFTQLSDLPLREDLARYLAGPTQMRDLALAKLEALSQKVNEALRNHQVQACDQGPYQGNGIPPACSLRPMTAIEEATELQKAAAWFEQREQLLRVNYAEMYSAWMQAFPLNQCWP